MTRTRLFAIATLLVPLLCSCRSAKFVDGRFDDKVVLDLGSDWSWTTSDSAMIQPIIRGRDAGNVFELAVHELEGSKTDDEVKQYLAETWKSGAVLDVSLGSELSPSKRIYSQTLKHGAETTVLQILLERRPKSTFAIVVKPGPAAKPQTFNMLADELLRKIEIRRRRMTTVSG